MTQEIAWQISLALMILLALVFAYVALNSGNAEDYPPLQKRAYGLRNKLFVLLAVLLLPPMLYTLIDLPYSESFAGTKGGDVQVIEAKSYQWRWELSSDRIAVGKPVEFRITSADVNHGFAIYDPDMRVVAQTQAMPGYVNKVRHTFDKPGTYRILCLEYCGIAHHNMTAELKVGAL